MIPGNCLLMAMLACLFGYRFASMRNRTGRLHFFWRDGEGRAFEFYKAGASRRTYLQNAFYFGSIKRAPALDEAHPWPTN